MGGLQEQRTASIIGSEMGSRENVLNHTGKGGESESGGAFFFFGRWRGSQLIFAREMGESSSRQIVGYSIDWGNQQQVSNSNNNSNNNSTAANMLRRGWTGEQRESERGGGEEGMRGKQRERRGQAGGNGEEGRRMGEG